MGLHALTCFGPDRTGLMAKLAEAITGLGCNVDDVSATILRGHGACMMIVQTPAEVGAGGLEEAAKAVLAGSGMAVNVQPCVAELRPAAAPTHVLSVYGADRPGIVHRLTTLLAGRGINITDLDSRIVGRSDRPIYAMLMEMELPPATDVVALRADLAALAKDLQVDASLRDVD